MDLLKKALLCLFIGVWTIVGIKTLFLQDQVATVLGDVHSTVAQAGPQLVGASFELRGAAIEQRRYAKATSKATVIASEAAARMLQHADQIILKLAVDSHTVLLNANETIIDTDKAVEDFNASQKSLAAAALPIFSDLDKQVKNVGSEGALAFSSARKGMDDADAILIGPVKTAAENVAKSANNISDATESIDIALKPLRKTTGKLKLILKWLLSIPHYSI